MLPSHVHGGGGGAGHSATHRVIDSNGGASLTLEPCGPALTFEHAHVTVWLTGALVVAASIFVLAEARFRSPWCAVPMETRRVGSPYRTTRVVTAHHRHAPTVVRAVAAACLTYALLGIPTLVLAWRTFQSQAAIVAVAAIAVVALGAAGVALLIRSRRAWHVVRTIATAGMLLFVPGLAVGLLGIFDAPACARTSWPAHVSIDTITVGLAGPFVALAGLLLLVERRHAALVG